MRSPSLTFKILVAVGVTVALVIAIYTYFVIRVQTQWWYERTQAQNVLATSMVSEHLQDVMVSGRSEEVQNFLQHLQKSQEVLRGRVIATDGKVVFSTEAREVNQVYFKTPSELFESDRILHGTRNENGQQIAMVMAPIKTQTTCFKCHDSREVYRGAVILEKSMLPAEASIASNRKLLIAYGVVIFVLVSVVIWLLVVRFVTQPVRGLLHEMHRVQQGDLSARATVEEEDEIGALSRGFNKMVQSLETTRRELHESHEKQIQQAGKLASIGELASGIAHEIRNPLAGIGAAVQVLAESGNGDGKYNEVAGEIHNQIARLNRTIRDLLDFARPREPEIEPCDVHEIIKPMLALVRPDAQKNQVRIVEEFTPGLPPISADTQQLQQAILNILLNATQAMPRGGTLTVATGLSAVESAVRISISDTGVGISPDSLQKIFSPFYTTKHRGTGLGLSITRTIVEKHCGKIRVESEVGRGTTFTLEFATFQLAGANGSNGSMPDNVGKEVLSHV